MHHFLKSALIKFPHEMWINCTHLVILLKLSEQLSFDCVRLIIGLGRQTDDKLNKVV